MRGPIIHQHNEIFYIVGIHLYTAQGISYGIQFSDRVRKTINSWIMEISGELNLWGKGIGPL